MTYFLRLLLLVTCVAHAQWAHTIGWGGAGWGKRTVRPPVTAQPRSRQPTSTEPRKPDSHLSLASPDMSDLTSDCQPDQAVLKLLSNIVQEEIVRVQRCLNLNFDVQES